MAKGPKQAEGGAEAVALPGMGLPEFEGIVPVGVSARLASSVGQRVQRAIRNNERVVLVIEAECVDVHHKVMAGGPYRVHDLRVLDFYEVTGRDGKRVLARARRLFRMAEDALGGRTKLTSLLDETHYPAGVSLDGQGVVMTEAELAAMRGEDWWDADLTPIVIVFEDATRGLWPDEWEGLGQTKARPGGFMRRPGSPREGDMGQVRQWLDADTGETLEEWTEQKEAARLLVLEEEAMAQEAAEDEAARDREAQSERVMDEVTAKRAARAGDGEAPTAKAKGSAKKKGPRR